MSRRRDCAPLLVDNAGQVAMRLERLPLIQRSLHEGWLQSLLFREPALLPVEEIDASFATLIPAR